MYHFSVECFGTPLTKFMNSKLPADNHKNMVKLIRGLVNGVRALHINKVAIGNLNIDDIFVGDNWTVKIAPINLSRKFHTSKKGSKGNRTKMSLMKTVTGFFSLDDTKADMKAVGKIIFRCYTKRKYNNECLYYPLPRPQEYVKFIPPDMLDLLNKLLHNGATAIDASSHYIFWSVEKTYDFIRAVSERLEAPGCTLRAKLEKAGASILGTERVGDKDLLVDWTTKFPHQFIAIMKSGKHGVLVDDGNKDEYYKYQGTKVYHLFQIIRNLLSHENSIRRKVARTQNPTADLTEMFYIKKGGLYSFLMNRFANLINQAYHNLKDEVHQDHRFTKFYQQFNLESDLELD